MSLQKISFFIFSILLCFQTSWGQASPDTEKIKVLNNYINFTNESTHGLLIVHRLLENFNKNINKFVDLPDQQINFYSNKDLPTDIFEDPENWFYDNSPNEWYAKIQAEKGKLPIATESKLNRSVSEMKGIIVSINKIRFDLDLNTNKFVNIIN